MDRRFTAYRILVGFTCQAPVFALYGLSCGLTYSGLMNLVLAFAAAKVLLDLPSGWFADRHGRRPALLVRVGLEAVSVALLLAREFVAASAVAGAAFAFSSGAETALVYEGAGQGFARTYGRGISWGFVSTAVAAVVGAALAGIDLRLVYVARFLCLGGAAVAAWGFRESPRRKSPEFRLPVTASLLRPLAFAGIVGAVQVAALQLQQPFLREAGVPLGAFGILYVGYQLATALGARLAHRVRAPLVWIVAASSAGFLLMALPVGIGGAAAVVLLKLAHGIAMPAVGRELGAAASGSSRALAMSFRSLFEGAALLIVAPLIGWAAEAASLHAAFGASALLVLPSLIFSGSAPCVVSGQSPASV